MGVDISATVEDPAGDADPYGVSAVTGRAFIVSFRTLEAREGKVGIFSTPIQMWTFHRKKNDLLSPRLIIGSAKFPHCLFVIRNEILTGRRRHSGPMGGFKRSCSQMRYTV